MEVGIVGEKDRPAGRRKAGKTMGTILDYLDWRGDLTLEQDSFNEVDNLLLAELSFLELTDIVPDVGRGRSVKLRKAVETYFAQREGEALSMGVLVPDQILTMARKMAKVPRFRDMRLTGFRSILDREREIQFAALTIELGDGSLYLSFRGTDDTLVGWKEDFNMTFLTAVPSQQLAVDYLRETAARSRGKTLRLGGHSKGGNLAVYAGVHCGAAVQKRLAAVYNNDGPGFKESLLDREEYRAVRDRIVTIVPQSSVVGMLLEHDDNYYVVQSSQQGLNQHDGFSWQVLGPAFVPAEERSQEGRVNEKAIRGFFANLDDSQRRMFVDAMFEVLGSTNAQTLTELDSDRFKSLTAMAKTFKDLDRESRQVLGEALRTILKASTDNLKEGLEEKGQELRRLWENKKQ